MGRRGASDALTELAFAAELLGDACPFAIDAKATASLAWNVRSAEAPTASSVAHLPGMTPLLLAVVDDALADRESPTLTRLKTLLPPGLFELRRVKGLGPKKVQRLWQELGIESLGELEYACRENRLVTLDGFGDKTQSAVLQQVQALADEAGLMRRDTATALAAPIVSALSGLGGRVVLAGALRRGAELVDRVVVVTTAPIAALPVPARVEIVWSTPERFGRDLIVATGSEAHVAALRDRAASGGVAFEGVAGEDEGAVYAALGLLETPPELREQGVLIEQGQARPRLVRRDDLRGALHNHTTASDGADELATMVQAAAAVGLSWFGVSDHSVAAAYAHGLDGPRLATQRAEIRALASTGVVVLSGVESDILKDGRLDLDDEVLAAGDVVVASMHQRYGQSGAPLTERLVRAARHPLVDVVGHPTGRLLLSRAPADFDVLALLDACAASGCAVELNANPARLDFGERWLREAKARGVLVSIAADAHAREELENLEHGVAVARRAGLGPDDVLNTRDTDGLRAWLRERRARAGVVAGGAT